MTNRDIGWVAGLLEGEGSFGWSMTTPYVHVSMTDEDVIDRYRRLLDLGQKIVRRWPDRKTAYQVVVRGRRAVAIMMTVYSLMGTRRRARIREVLIRWRALRSTSRRSCRISFAERG